MTPSCRWPERERESETGWVFGWVVAGEQKGTVSEFRPAGTHYRDSAGENTTELKHKVTPHDSLTFVNPEAPWEAFLQISLVDLYVCRNALVTCATSRVGGGGGGGLMSRAYSIDLIHLYLLTDKMAWCPLTALN